MCNEKRNVLLVLEEKLKLGKISQDMIGEQNNTRSRVLKRKGGQ